MNSTLRIRNRDLSRQISNESLSKSNINPLESEYL